MQQQNFSMLERREAACFGDSRVPCIHKTELRLLLLLLLRAHPEKGKFRCYFVCVFVGEYEDFCVQIERRKAHLLTDIFSAFFRLFARKKIRKNSPRPAEQPAAIYVGNSVNRGKAEWTGRKDEGKDQAASRKAFSEMMENNVGVC